MPKPVGALFLLLFLLAASGCGTSQDSNPALTEYFDAVQRVMAASDVQSTEIETDLDERLRDASDEETVEASRDFFSASLRLGEAIVADLRGLDVPASVRTEHDAFVAGLEGVVQALQDEQGTVDQAATQDEIFSLMASTVFAWTTTLESVCSNLEAKAAAEGIEVDLSCDGQITSDA